MATQTRTTFTPAELDTLRTAYATLERVSVERLADFHRLCDGCTDTGLQQLAHARINFVSKLAENAISIRQMTPELPWILTKDLAVAIRSALAHTWPHVTFSVRSESFSQGSAVRVQWIDGPTPRDIEHTLQPFEGKDFDGQTDSSTYRRIQLPDGRLVKSGAWITAFRSLSPEGHALALRLFELKYQQPYDANAHLIGQFREGWAYGSDGLHRIEHSLRFTATGYVLVTEKRA